MKDNSKMAFLTLKPKLAYGNKCQPLLTNVKNLKVNNREEVVGS